jgi:hypothetical protein
MVAPLPAKADTGRGSGRVVVGFALISMVFERTCEDFAVAKISLDAE